MSNNEEDYNNEDSENDSMKSSMTSNSMNSNSLNSNNMKNSSLNSNSMKNSSVNTESVNTESVNKDEDEDEQEEDEEEDKEEKKNNKNVILTGKAGEDNEKATAAALLGKPNNTNINKNKNKNTKKNMGNMGNKNKNLNENLTMKNKNTNMNTNMNNNNEGKESSSDITTAESQIESEGTVKTNSEQRVSLNRLCMNLLNHQIVVKLYHFQTQQYGAHKASDAYIEKYANTLDKFLEVAQGIYGKITLKKYSLAGSSHTDENIIKHINGMIMYWREKIDDILGNYTDLINIRDELVGDAEQLKYLLSFK